MFGQLLYHYTQHYYIDEEQVIYNTLLQGAIWFVVLIILCVLAAVAGQIFLALAVYQNAKSRGNANPGMWGVLTGFFGWIPAVIYLATRDSARNRPIVCSGCGTYFPVSWNECPKCHAQNVYAQQFNNPMMEQNRSLSKKFLITAIVLEGAAVLAIIISVIVFAATAASTAISYSYTPYL